MLTIVNTVKMNKDEQVPLWLEIESFMYIPSSNIAETHGTFISRTTTLISTMALPVCIPNSEEDDEIFSFVHVYFF